MFGVLVVVAPDGRVGWLKAFSGQLAGLWEVAGWVPPVFDASVRGDLEPSFVLQIKRLTEERERLAASEAFRQSREASDHGRAVFLRRRTELKADFAARARLRRERRALSGDDRVARKLLDQESRREHMERRRLEAALAHEERESCRSFRRLERRLRAMERLRRFVSRRVMRRLHDTYRLPNARGGSATLRDLFAPGEPPWGAADCAAPKLLAFAIRQGLTPLALAEFWWGPPPPGGGRVEGAFFPACRSKCGPVLPFLLEGIETAPRRTVKPDELPETHLVTLHLNRRIVVVSKPAGMLSVPARDEEVKDSVWARLRRLHPRAERPLVVHRLDLDTSGVLLAALDIEAYRYLQTQFAGRKVRKRYIVWLEGEITGDGGTVALPLRLDLDQRPRQVVDFVHGREAITDWKVLERRGGRTRVAFFPRTGRTHQLRVHAAHPEGLGAPIVGDRLYGRPGDRLLLHAEALSFINLDGRRLTVADPVPF